MKKKKIRRKKIERKLKVLKEALDMVHGFQEYEALKDYAYIRLVCVDGKKLN